MLASIAVDTGSAPAPLVYGFGSIWVGTHRGNTLYRIDPNNDKIIARIDLNQSTCQPIKIGAGRVWTNFCDDSTKELAVDPQTNQVAGSIKTDTIYGFTGGFGWAASSDGTNSIRFDANTLRTVATIPTWGVDGAIANGYLWIAGGDPDTASCNDVITKIDPNTGKILARLHTPDTGTSMFMAAVRGILWLKGAIDDFLVRVDTTTGRASRVAIAHFGFLPAFNDDPPVADGSSLWLRTASETVTRLNGYSGHPEQAYPADSSAGGGYVAVGSGSLWIANFSTDTIWRDKI